jgi:hypothetical protein
VTGRSGSRAWCRVAAARLVAPTRRSRLIPVLRRVAMTWGPAWVRTWERSSSKVTSRWFSWGQRGMNWTSCQSCEVSGAQRARDYATDVASSRTLGRNKRLTCNDDVHNTRGEVLSKPLPQATGAT